MIDMTLTWKKTLKNKLQQNADQVQHFGIRKLSIGVTSVLLSTLFYVGAINTNTVQASIDIEVYSRVTGIEVNVENITLQEGTQYQIVTNIEPDDANNKTVQYISENINPLDDNFCFI